MYTSWNQASVTCSTVMRTTGALDFAGAEGMRVVRLGSLSARTASREGEGSPCSRHSMASSHQAFACAFVSKSSYRRLVDPFSAGTEAWKRPPGRRKTLPFAGRAIRRPCRP